jgi:hypothetical protein
MSFLRENPTGIKILGKTQWDKILRKNFQWEQNPKRRGRVLLQTPHLIRRAHSLHVLLMLVSW